MTLVLKNVDITDILGRLYGRDVPETAVDETYDVYSHEEETEARALSVPMTKLRHERSRKKIHFIDPHKHTVKAWINMYDISENGPLPVATSKPCWWCRSSFKTCPIGCPIKYYTDDVTGKIRDDFKAKLSERNLPQDSVDWFETEGLFCSFPCVKAFVLDSRDTRYKESLTLLSLLYYKLTGKSETIVQSPSWKSLIDWGGHLTPAEFRECFDRLSLKDTPNFRRPYMYASSRYIEEKKINS